LTAFVCGILTRAGGNKNTSLRISSANQTLAILCIHTPASVASMLLARINVVIK
jgi:hypothetical protein